MARPNKNVWTDRNLAFPVSAARLNKIETDLDAAYDQAFSITGGGGGMTPDPVNNGKWLRTLSGAFVWAGVAAADVSGLGGAATLNVGTTGGTVAAGDDSRMTNARTPTSHATTHKSGGSDVVKLDELDTPTDVTTLNSTTSAHGLLRKLDNNNAHYLDGTGAWTTPPAGGGGTASVLGFFDTRDYGVKVDLTRADNADTTGGNATILGTTYGATGVEAGKLIQVQAAGANIFTGTGNGNMSNAAQTTANRFTCSAVTFTTAVIGRWLTIMTGTTVTLRARVIGVESATQLRLNAPAGSVLTNKDWYIAEDHYTTIASTSAGVSATLTVAPVRSTKDAIVWYGSDDATAIQAAVTAAEVSGNGGTVYHKGASAIGTAIYMQKATQFVGSGSRGYSDLIAQGTTRLRLMKPAIRGLVGAGSDTVTGVNGAMTSGSAVLTDPNANFQVGDVGKNIVVYQAGTQTGSTDGIFLNTTILSRASATSVTLNANAGTTVTGAIYTYSSTQGYNGGLVGPSVKNVHVVGGPGQIAGVHLVNCSESVLHEVCCSGFSSGVGIFIDGGPSFGFTNQVTVSNCYAIDNRIGIKQDRGSFYLAGNCFIDGNSNRVDCQMIGGMTYGIDGNYIDNGGWCAIQAVGTCVKSSGRGGGNCIGTGWGMENMAIMFDLASADSNSGKNHYIGFDSTGNSNAGGGSGIKLRAGAVAKLVRGFSLDGDVDMYGLVDPAAQMIVVGEAVVKNGPISDTDFVNQPVDGSYGVDTANSHFQVRIGHVWKYANLTGLAGRIKKIAAVQQSSGSTTLVLNCLAPTIPVGHHVAVAIGYGLASTQTIAVTDSKGNTYVKNIQADLNTGATPHAAIAIGRVTTALVAGDTITVTFGASVNVSDAIAYEYAPLLSASWIDGTPIGATGTSTTPNSGNVVTTQASDLLISVTYHAAATTTAGANWTLVDSQDNVGVKRLDVQERVVFATGTYAGTETLSGSVDWASVIVAAKAAP